MSDTRKNGLCDKKCEGKPRNNGKGFRTTNVQNPSNEC